MGDVSGVADEGGDAFVGFYGRYHDRVYEALALTLRDPELAADCVQEAMIRAYRRWPSLDPDRNPAGWLYRVGLNVARSRWRRLRRELLRGRVEDRPDPDAVIVSRDPELDRALRRLPTGQRAVIVLRFLEDWSVDEVAEALGVAAGTVKSRQHRALDRLRQELEVSRGSRNAPTHDAG